MKVRPPETATGVGLNPPLVLPLPSWPTGPFPQHQAAPVGVSAQRCSSPTATVSSDTVAGTGTGRVTETAGSCCGIPQQYTTSEVDTAQLPRRPAEGRRRVTGPVTVTATVSAFPPLDTITWTMTNSQRQDVPVDPTGDRFGRRQSLIVLPYDELPMFKWNGNPYNLDGGNGGRNEDDGVYFLLPYWMARYHKLILQ